jgi:hypothetical protein
MMAATETHMALTAAKALMIVNNITTIMVTTPTVCEALYVLLSFPTHTLLDHPDTDSDVDGYGGRYAPSAELFGPSHMGYSESSAPTLADYAGPLAQWKHTPLGL